MYIFCIQKILREKNQEIFLRCLYSRNVFYTERGVKLLGNFIQNSCFLAGLCIWARILMITISLWLICRASLTIRYTPTPVGLVLLRMVLRGELTFWYLLFARVLVLGVKKIKIKCNRVFIFKVRQQFLDQSSNYTSNLDGYGDAQHL